MKKERYAIPEGCKSITVESDSDKLLIRFGHLDPGEFRSELTDSLERAPIVGNVAIFWNDEARKQAIIAKCLDWESLENGISYKANDGNWYNNAIRFRNDKQFNQIIGDENKIH